MTENMTVEKLRALRAVQVSGSLSELRSAKATKPWMSRSHSTQALTAAEDGEGDGGMMAMRPLHERRSLGCRLAIGGCVSLCIAAIIWGSVRHVEPPKPHTKGHHKPVQSSTPATVASPAPTGIGTAVYAAHRSLETSPESPFRTESYPLKAPLLELQGPPAEHGFLMGPFETLPGDWITALVTEEMASVQLRAVDRVVEFTGDAVDESGRPLLYPPVHVHHVHVGRGHLPDTALPNGDGLQQHWMETHGDYALTERGYTTATPPGSCRVKGDAPLTVWGQLIDVRDSGDGSNGGGADGARLRWWLRIRFVISEVACEPIGKLLIWYPFSDGAMSEQIYRYQPCTVPPHDARTCMRPRPRAHTHAPTPTRSHPHVHTHSSDTMSPTPSGLPGGL